MGHILRRRGLKSAFPAGLIVLATIQFAFGASAEDRNKIDEENAVKIETAKLREKVKLAKSCRKEIEEEYLLIQNELIEAKDLVGRKINITSTKDLDFNGESSCRSAREVYPKVARLVLEHIGMQRKKGDTIALRIELIIIFASTTESKIYPSSTGMGHKALTFSVTMKTKGGEPTTYILLSPDDVVRIYDVAAQAVAEFEKPIP